jgi:hypothetical protein
VMVAPSVEQVIDNTNAFCVSRRRRFNSCASWTAALR